MSKAVVRMTIDDAYHYTDEQRALIISSYPAHELDARIKGLPALGSGRVFPVAEGDITCEPFSIPQHWFQIAGIDFGWDHPFAAVKLAIDADSNSIYVTNAYRQRESTPVTHARAMKAWADPHPVSKDPWLPVAWPHDGHQHDKGSGQALAAQYRSEGLATLEEHATHADGGYGIEAGIMGMLDYMKTGRFKVFSHLSEWFEEYRYYHRLEGIIVKERDDLLSATRVAFMMRRYAMQPPKKPTKYDFATLAEKASPWAA